MDLIGWFITIVVMIIAFVWWVCTAIFVTYFLITFLVLIVGFVIGLYKKLKGGE